MPHEQQPRGPSASAPLWASASAAGPEAIEFRRAIGAITSAESGEQLDVQLVQRHELDDLGGASDPGTPWIVVGGVRLNPAQARELSQLLAAACDLVGDG